MTFRAESYQNNILAHIKERVICSCPPLFTAFEAVQFPLVAFCMRGSKLPDLSKNFVFGDHDADHRKGEEKVWDKCPFSEGDLFFCVRQIVGWPLVKIFSQKKKEKGPLSSS